MKLVVFICNWCYNIDTDIEDIDGIKVIRVMCTGRVETGIILKALELGAEGVLVIGCQKGECHYVRGNEQAEKTIKLTKELIRVLGISPERIKLECLPKDEQWKISKLISPVPDKICSYSEHQ